MKNTLVPASVLLALSAALLPTPAIACGVAPDWVIVKSQRELDSFRKVKGTYRIVERIETPYIDDDGQEIVSATLIGRIDTARGTSWNTVHSISGYIVMCASFYPPQAEGKGVFYISRSRIPSDEFPALEDRDRKRYEMHHWDGQYFPFENRESNEENEQ